MGMARAQKPKQASENVTREKILSTARELFYRDGVRAVGVDTIVAEADVAKTSLYRWFGSKDDLIASFLANENDAFWDQWDKVASEHEGGPVEALRAHLAWIQSYVVSERFRGCPFLNVTAEFRDAEHPARAVCRENKAELRRRLSDLTRRLTVDDPEILADQLLLLIDGAFANTQVLGKSGPGRALERGGNTLIDAALKG
jgi:AcrR family transcriptional regulator